MPNTIHTIDSNFNYDNTFFRMLHISLARTLNRRIRWVNYFKGEKKCVTVPIYLSFAGSERFILDSFMDDITDKRVELNTDQIPRGIIVPSSFTSVKSEMTNPNIYIPKSTKIHDKYTKIISKIRAIPINVNYEIEIRLDSEIDIYKCSEKIMDLFFSYKYFNMDYFGIKIDNILELPDDRSIQLPRDSDITLDSDNVKSITFSLNVYSNYPSWKIDTDDIECNDTDFDKIKRVYWENYVYDIDKIDKNNSEKHKSKEDFNKEFDFQKDNPEYNKFDEITPSGITWG
jgi:hypothetical protein